MPATVTMGHDVTPLFREAYPQHTAKRAAQAAEVPHETARNWVRGYAVPSAVALLRMAENCDAFASALERRLAARRAARGAGLAGANAGPGPAPDGALAAAPLTPTAGERGLSAPEARPTFTLPLHAED